MKLEIHGTFADGPDHVHFLKVREPLEESTQALAANITSEGPWMRTHAAEGLEALVSFEALQKVLRLYPNPGNAFKDFAGFDLI